MTYMTYVQELSSWQEEQFKRITAILADVKFNTWRVTVSTGPHDFCTRHTPYLQVVVNDGTNNVTGEPMMWKGRKWQLSYHMTDTEIVRTAYLAVQKAVEHETSEQFKYKGVSVYDPHFKIDDLVKLALHNDLDGRVPGPTW